MKHPVIGVLKGGPSSEREVSLRTGAAVAEALRSLGYPVQEVDLTGTSVDLPPSVEFVFICLHGTFGEDGSLQKILEGKRMGYTGSGVVSSQTAFDKELSKIKFVEAGVPTPIGEVLRDNARTRLKAPMVLKPSCQGSSIGLELVFEDHEIQPALERARKHGGVILAEPFIRGRELTVGILDGRALPIVEIRPKHGYYDYQNKYTAGATEYLCPADLPEDVTAQVRCTAEKAHAALGCEVYSRVDVMLDEANRPWVLEVNTIPGMTATSLLPKAAKAAGMEFPALCEAILTISMKLRGGKRA